MVVIGHYVIQNGSFRGFYILQDSAVESIMSIYTVVSASLASEGELTSCERNERNELNEFSKAFHETEFSS